MTDPVVHTALKPLHDITLTDGTTTVGFILTDGNGNKNPRAITESPQQRLAIKTTSGDSKYSDLTPPWSDVVQEDWSAGRGAAWFEDDRSKFWDSAGVDTSDDDGIILASAPSYTIGNYNDGIVQRWYSSADTPSWFSGTGYIAQKFTCPAAITTIRNVQLILKWKNSAAPSAVISLRADSTGEPAAAKLQYATVVLPDNDDPLYTVNISSSNWNTLATLTPGNSYWIVFENAAGDDLEVLGYTSNSADCKSNTAGTWANAGIQLYHRVLPGLPFQNGFFFEYKSGLYFVSRPDTGNSILYRNGSRGTADSNSGNLDKLIDAAQSWTVNAWADCTVLVFRGTGSDEEKPWRRIVSNTATQLVVDGNWKITHDTTTQYVILGGNIWYTVLDLGTICTSAAVADEIVYFARGQTYRILRYQEYNAGGTWTVRSAEETEVNAYAQRILAIPRGGETYIYRAREGDPDGWSVAENISPRAWGGLIPTSRALIAPTNQPWDNRVITNVTQSVQAGQRTRVAIAAGFTTGFAAVENLDAPVDITSFNRVGFYIKSSVATASGDIELVLSDQFDLNPEKLPTAVMQYDSSGATWVDPENAYDGDTDTSATIAVDTGDWLYFASDDQFNEIYYSISSANVSAATVTYQYFDGEVWKSLSVTDNTVAAGVPFASSNSVYWTLPWDWQPKTVNLQTGYMVRLKVSAGVSFGASELSVQRDTRVYLDIPALIADQWAWVTITIAPTEKPDVDYTRIQCVALHVATDNGAQTVDLDGGIYATATGVIIDFPEQKITNMVSYAGSASTNDNPWIFTDQGVYEIQTENGGQVVKLPIGELAELRSFTNGAANAVNDVYLYFNLGEKFQRYYSRNLDDIGPDKGEDWNSTERQGTPVSASSYPGRVYLAVRGTDKFSSIFLWKGGGWHDVHRSPTNVQIHNIWIQAIPDRTAARLWFAEGSDIGYIIISLDPYNDSQMVYLPEGYVTSSWISGGLLDIYKVFGAAQVFCDHSSGTSVQLDYRLNGSTSGWTELSGTFDTEPSESINFPTTSGGVRAKSLQYRLRLRTTVLTNTPKVQALLLSNYAVVPVKYAYNFTSVLREDYLSIDLQGEQELALAYNIRAETAYTQLKTWANGGYPLTMNSRFSVYDGKTVILNPPASSPVRIDSESQHEEILLSISLFDL